MKILKNKAALSLLFLGSITPALSSCGFQPIYADSDRVLSTTLNQIEVLPILTPELASYVLENEIGNSISAMGGRKYTLEVKLKDRRRSAAVTSTAQTARFEYTLNGVYTLTNLEDGKKYRNEKTAVTSYGIVTSQYASKVAQEDAIRKAAIQLADQMETDLVLYFKGQVSGTEISSDEKFKEPTEQETLREKQLEEILGEDY